MINRRMGQINHFISFLCSRVCFRDIRKNCSLLCEISLMKSLWYCLSSSTHTGCYAADSPRNTWILEMTKMSSLWSHKLNANKFYVHQFRAEKWTNRAPGPMRPSLYGPDSQAGTGNVTQKAVEGCILPT